jgi:hypothetical protein
LPAPQNLYRLHLLRDATASAPRSGAALSPQREIVIGLAVAQQEETSRAASVACAVEASAA